MLDDTLKAQLKAYLERLQQPIEVTAYLDDSDATKALREALEARRKKTKPVMPDFLSDTGGMH